MAVQLLRLKFQKIPAVAHPLTEKSTEIASNIKYHAEYTPHFSPFKFELEQAYYATADSVRDRLIKQWNETYSHYHKVNPKQTYYLSMEYLQGRALTNAVGNLDVQDAYADALKQLGHALEDIVEQEKDAALGNGGLGRLASCFLDSMATLNLPAWGYGLRYRYGLFKQRITKAGQEEIAEDWLEKFSPWEVVRHDVVFPVRFFGQVEVHPTGSRKWVGGEVIQAVAYDVPIPGYKTKNTNSLRLWEAKACAEDFSLFQFNDGEYESAALLHSRAQQICAVLYPGDATENGKLLRLKQQFFLCSASLQDIIARFKERNSDNDEIMWSEFPSKVAVQLNDTHPTLAIPELMRLLMDGEGLGWDEAWNITTSTIAYTNHTVLPEALEKWSQAVMWKLLPRHMEIIEEIDKRVNGVAQLHSDILKAELFADYVSIWPGKFQNKTNGITPRRWLRFCNPELSHIITKWLKTDQWVTNLDLLANLRQEMSPEDRKRTTPRTIMIGGKAFATYTNAKRIVKLVNDVGAIVNNDPEVNSCLKFKPDPRFEEAKQFIRSGAFGNYDYNPLIESLEGNSGYGRGDYFLVGCDFPSYMDAQERVDEAYKDRKRWIKMSILSTAGSGKFSSDRTIAQYAKEIWNINECPARRSVTQNLSLEATIPWIWATTVARFKAMLPPQRRSDARSPPLCASDTDIAQTVRHRPFGRPRLHRPFRQLS
ncbi:UNVERIFIED_CONTAM: Alpha-glucan phosphorylase, H isozyme [Sesamum radiatum]|uniref:Alpha-1,4 glucan phosphorylase n=1 Tax=Sesamum radiatum TaxID=300843 RepID=A0AAW2NAP3_SESRA